MALEPSSVGGVLVSEQSKVRLTVWVCFMYLHRYILIWLSTTAFFFKKKYIFLEISAIRKMYLAGFFPIKWRTHFLATVFFPDKSRKLAACSHK